jgi:integrase
MSSVKFNLNNVTETNALIRAVYFYGSPSKRLVYSTKVNIRPEIWDKDKNRVKTVKGNDSEKINAILNRINEAMQTVHSNYILGKNEDELTLNIFRDELDVLLDRKEKVKPNVEEIKVKLTLFEFIDIFIKNRIELGYSDGIVNKYRQTRMHLNEYRISKKRVLDFEHITLEFFEDFMKYMNSKISRINKNFKQNNIQKLIAVLKTILTDATDKGYNDKMDFKKRKFGTHTEKVQSIYLNQNELKELYEFDLSDKPRLERVRDLFIVESYTGLRFGDGQRLEAENIIESNGKEFVSIKTQKTGQGVVIPMHPFVKNILDKYNCALPEISNVKMNEYVKEVGELVGFDEKVSISATRGGKRIDTTYSKFKLITTHTARRSFATNAFIMGVPTLSIMMITGHTTETSFMKYIKISNQENAVLMSEHAFFRGETVEPHQLKKVS